MTPLLPAHPCLPHRRLSSSVTQAANTSGASSSSVPLHPQGMGCPAYLSPLLALPSPTAVFLSAQNGLFLATWPWNMPLGPLPGPLYYPPLPGGELPLRQPKTPLQEVFPDATNDSCPPLLLVSFTVHMLVFQVT